MTPVKISVVTPTNRLGGIDLGFHSLSNQTLKDFEWVLVDELIDFRRELVSDLAKKYSMQVKHLEPMRIGRKSFGTHWNTAFIYAEGELIMTMDDYAWLRPDVLERHWAEYEKSGKETLLCGPTHEAVFPPNKYGVIPLMEGSKILVEPDYYSIFTEPVDKIFPAKMEVLRRDARWAYHEEDADGFVPQGTLKTYVNMTLPLDVVLALNGYDVGYDAGHGFRDQDLPARAEIYGMKFRFDPKCEYFHLDHGKVFAAAFGAKEKNTDGVFYLDINAGFMRNKFITIYDSKGATLPALNPYWLQTLRKQAGMPEVQPRPPKFRFALPRVRIRMEVDEIAELGLDVDEGRRPWAAFAEFFLSRKRGYELKMPDGSTIVLTWKDRTVQMWAQSVVNYDSVLYHGVDALMFDNNPAAKLLLDEFNYAPSSVDWIVLVEKIGPKTAPSISAAKSVARKGVILISTEPVRETLRSGEFPDYTFTEIENADGSVAFYCGIGLLAPPAARLE